MSVFLVVLLTMPMGIAIVATFYEDRKKENQEKTKKWKQFVKSVEDNHKFYTYPERDKAWILSNKNSEWKFLKRSIPKYIEESFIMHQYTHLKELGIDL